MSQPTKAWPDRQRRSQLYRWHQQQGARYTSGTYPQIVSYYETAQASGDLTAPLMLCDLSLLDRTGYKGRGAGDWLSAYASLPAKPNTAVTGATQKTLIARLSHEEYLLIDRLEQPQSNGTKIGVAASFACMVDQHFDADKPPLCYPLPRRDSHCLFALTGRSVPAMMAKVCAIDLHADQFKEGFVAQTSVARLNAIIIRQSGIPVPSYLLLADVSYAEYLWQALLDAMSEFSGVAVGLDELQEPYANE